MLAKVGVIAAVVPVVLWAYEYGPNPGYAGVPGENGGATCTASGCHIGRTNDPNNKGSVSVNVGSTYTPGVTQHLTVTIADPATTQRAWGFELTARQASSPSTVAGTLTSVDNLTQLMCSQTNLFIFRQVTFSPSSRQSCPSGEPLLYIEHTRDGYNASFGHTGSWTYNFDWTPPSTDVGNIVIYVAGNAVNGDLNTTGDHVYATTYTLTPAGSGPSISSVSNAAGRQAGVFPGSFISVYGSGFTTISYDDWTNSITNGLLPTQLDGVSVSVGGKPAYIYAISPGQINAQAPDIPVGNTQVTVTNSSGTSSPFATTAQQVAPAFWPWPASQPVATHNDFTIAAKNGTIPQQSTVPAKPGEVITLWGTGFGATNPPVPAGQVPGNNAGAPTQTATVTLGGADVTVISSVISPYPGDYQVAIQIPASQADGDYPVIASINGVPSPSYMLTVQH